MSRVLASLALLLTAAVAAPAADAPSLSIRWHGQSFFEITTTKGTNIVLDPHAIPEYPRVSMKANLVLMSHLHDDHTQTHVVDNLKDHKQVKDVKFRNVGCYHDDMQGLKRGKNGIWIIEADGLKIVHLGDLGHQLTDDQIKKIGEVDILMIPVGGVYTLNGIDAQKVVKQLNPRHYVIPMHYGTAVYDSLLPIKSFIEELDEEAQKTQIKRVSGNEMLIDPAEKATAKPIYVMMGFKKLGG
jgi:L-ascorbate metabolism protein UlaG (beta-lactamase superfamily)